MRVGETATLLRGKQGPSCRQGTCLLGTSGADAQRQTSRRELAEEPLSSSPLHLPGGHPHPAPALTLQGSPGSRAGP